MSTPEGSILEALIYFLGGTVRWCFKKKEVGLLKFINDPKEINKNLKYGYFIFFSLLIGISSFWYIAFRPGR